MDDVGSWKDKSTELFFEKKLSIQEISSMLDVSRKSISKHLVLQHGYTDEKEKRKKVNFENRKEYKRNWDRVNRPGRYTSVTGDTMKREHILAVSILSHEKY